MRTNREISEFTERWVKITQSRKKREKEEQSLTGTWGIMNCTNICTIGIPKKEKKNKIVKEIMAKFPQNSLNLHIQNDQQTPSQTHIKKSASRNMLKTLQAKARRKSRKQQDKDDFMAYKELQLD